MALTTGMCLDFFASSTNSINSRGSAVGLATGYGLEDQEVRVPVESRVFTPPYRPDRLWGQYNLLSNGCRRSFLGGKGIWA
jgi:hypothetical protein